jgi:hypothetical protein
MKAEELYELRIGASVTQKALATHLGIDRRIAGRSKDLSSGAYVNLHKVPMTGTSLAGSLNMRNLTRFLLLGIARVMGKSTPKGDKTISYQRALHGVAALSPTADRPTQRLAG